MNKLLLLFVFVAYVGGATLTYDMDAVSQKIQDNLDVCWDESSTGFDADAYPGGCGCDYPKEFCFWYENESDDLPGLSAPEVGCYKLSQECQDLLGDTGLESGESTESSTASSSESSSTGGGDYHPYCCWWAGQGECDKNVYFMRPVCQKSCGTKGCSVTNAPNCAVTVNTANCKWDDTDDTVASTLAPVLTTPSGTGPVPGGCGDTNRFCAFWASVGECGKNPAWMNTGCGKSCGLC